MIETKNLITDIAVNNLIKGDKQLPSPVISFLKDNINNPKFDINVWASNVNDAIVLQTMRIKTLGLAYKLVGGLSQNGKMPTKSWGIPASLCKTGGKLHLVENTPCKKCYALKNHFAMINTLAANFRRYAIYRLIDRDIWVAAFIHILWTNTAIRKHSVFRFLDTGDIQDLDMLHRFIDIAIACPDILIWIPTQERKILAANKLPIPKNLIIRVSSSKINKRQTSKHTGLDSWVATDKSDVSCIAYKQKNSCGNCRDCWNAKVISISYPLH